MSVCRHSPGESCQQAGGSGQQAGGSVYQIGELVNRQGSTGGGGGGGGFRSAGNGIKFNSANLAGRGFDQIEYAGGSGEVCMLQHGRATTMYNITTI